MIVCIAEKPSVARDIAEVLGARDRKEGYIEGNGSEFTVYEFRSEKKIVWNKTLSEIPEYKNSGHGGGDMALVCDFLEAVDSHDESKLTSNIDASIESHVMGFRAEKSRLSKKKVDVSK